MTYVQIVEGENIIDKYIPDQCECGKFLTKSGDCNSCGMSMCKGCGEMLDHGDPCENCQPKEYLKSLDDDIEVCQHDNEVKSCDECQDKDSYCFDGQKKRIEQELNENTSSKLKLIFESEDQPKNMDEDFILFERDTDKHKYILSDIASKKVENNEQYILLIGGHIGTGKSLSAISLAEDIDPYFNIDRIAFDVPDMLNLINRGMPEGSVILWEGDTKISTVSPTDFHKINKEILTIFEAIKKNNWILIITLADPNKMSDNIRCKIDGFAKMITAKNEEYGWIKYFNVRYDEENHKLIHRFPRLIDGDGRNIIIKGKDKDSANMKFALPSTEIVIAYDKLLSGLYAKKESEQNG